MSVKIDIQNDVKYYDPWSYVGYYYNINEVYVGIFNKYTSELNEDFMCGLSQYKNLVNCKQEGYDKFCS